MAIDSDANDIRSPPEDVGRLREGFLTMHVGRVQQRGDARSFTMVTGRLDGRVAISERKHHDHHHQPRHEPDVRNRRPLPRHPQGDPRRAVRHHHGSRQHRPRQPDRSGCTRGRTSSPSLGSSNPTPITRTSSSIPCSPCTSSTRRGDHHGSRATDGIRPDRRSRMFGRRWPRGRPGSLARLLYLDLASFDVVLPRAPRTSRSAPSWQNSSA